MPQGGLRFLKTGLAFMSDVVAASRFTFRWWAFNKALGTALVLSVLAFGFFLPYWRHADQDLALIYEGLLALNGLPQEYFDHPGYAYFLVIGGWFRLLDWVGLLPVHAFADFPPLSDPAALDAAWTQLVYAGRALSVLLAALLVFVFAELTRRIFNDARLAGVAAVAFASGMGIMTQARQLRTEMVSGGLTMAALLLALLAARTKPGGKALAYLILAGACAALAVTAKVQAVFLIAAIPVVLIAFGEKPAAVDPEGMAGEQAWLWAALAFCLSELSSLPAGSLFYYGLTHWGEALHPFKPLGGGLSATGIYQGVFIGWLALAMLLYARIWRLPAAYALQGVCALSFGAAMGMSVLFVRYHPQNVIAVTNFIEQMFVFSSWRHGAELGGEGPVATTSLIKLVGEGLWRTFAIRTIVLHPDNIPQTLLVEWFVIFAAAKAWRGGRRGDALRMLTPLAVAWGLEAVFSLRGFQRAYAIYTDPLTVLAGVAALRAFPHWLEVATLRRRVYAGLALLVVLAHVWPAVSERRKVDPAQHCDWLPIYLPRVEGFPFCVNPAPAPR
jgi:hypothetical protein